MGEDFAVPEIVVTSISDRFKSNDEPNPTIKFGYRSSNAAVAARKSGSRN
jgi:hypothetical protein